MSNFVTYRRGRIIARVCVLVCAAILLADLISGLLGHDGLNTVTVVCGGLGMISGLAFLSSSAAVADSTPVGRGARQVAADWWECFLSILARWTVRPSRRAPVVRLKMPLVLVGGAVVGYVAPTGDGTAWQYALDDGTALFPSATYAIPEFAALALAADVLFSADYASAAAEGADS